MESIVETCVCNAPGWSGVTQARTTLLPSGSNTIYLVEAIRPTGLKAIYRKFGRKDGLIADYERKIAYRLSEIGIGPRIFTETEEYRLEEYLPGRTLDRLEVRNPAIIPLICHAIHEFHGLDMTSIVPVISTSVRNVDIWRGECILSGQFHAGKEILSEEMYGKFVGLMGNLEGLCFCHMDCYGLNCILGQGNQVRLVDYEYSGYNYRGMDLASVLNGLLYDYQAPNPPYLEYHPEDRCNSKLLTQYIKAYGGDAHLWTETKLCIACDHYIWSIWALFMQGHGRPGFDYLTYADIRTKDFIHEIEEIEACGGREGVLSIAERLLLSE